MINTNKVNITRNPNAAVYSKRITKYDLTKRDIVKFLKRIPRNYYAQNRKHFIKKYKFYFFLVKNRRLLRFFYGGMKQKELFKRVKLMRKKHHWNTCLHLFLNLELRLNSFLYHNQLIPKVKLLKQLILHNYVKVNKQTVKGYSFNTKITDIVSTEWQTSTLMLDKRFKLLIKRKLRRIKALNHSFFFLKHTYGSSAQQFKSIFLKKINLTINFNCNLESILVQYIILAKKNYLHLNDIFHTKFLIFFLFLSYKRKL